jgi:peptide/nickel transport system ATP-binding protein
MPPILLSVSGLSKAYDGVRVLDGVNFDMAKGETLGLFGKSGSGKSTIGRCITMLDKPSAGEIRFNGKDILRMKRKEFAPIRPRIQMIFQHPETSLDPRMTAYRSIIEPMLVQKLVKKTGVANEVHRLLDLVGLNDEHLVRYPGQLSGGEIQRIVLARILSLKPEFIVADEPTSMLDVSVQAQILRLMQKVQSETGVSYLLISHDIEVLRAVCDRIAYLDDGIISKIEKT